MTKGEVEHLTPDKKVKKTIITEGYGSDKPGKGYIVKVNYVGKLQDGTEFDSNTDKDHPFEFELGKDSVIKGWELAIATMTRNEKCSVTIAPEYAYGEQGYPPKIGPNETLEFEIHLLDWTGENLTEDGKVIKTIMKHGDGYESLTVGSKVNIHLKGSLEGKTFLEDDYEFLLAETGEDFGILEIVETAVMKMKKKERCKITVHPDYGYDAAGREKYGIPDGATCHFEIYLSNYDRAKDEYDMTFEEKMQYAETEKTQGVEYFNQGQYKRSLVRYDRALYMMNKLWAPDEVETAKPLIVKLYLNKALSQSKMKKFPEMLNTCELALRVDDKCVKAQFRKAQSLMYLTWYHRAVEAFEKVIQMDPENKAAQACLAKAKEGLKKSLDKQKTLYSSMLSGISPATQAST